MEDKSPIKGPWSGLCDAFKILRPQWYLWFSWSQSRQIL